VEKGWRFSPKPLSQRKLVDATHHTHTFLEKKKVCAEDKISVATLPQFSISLDKPTDYRYDFRTCHLHHPLGRHMNALMLIFLTARNAR